MPSSNSGIGTHVRQSCSYPRPLRLEETDMVQQQETVQKDAWVQSEALLGAARFVTQGVDANDASHPGARQPQRRVAAGMVGHSCHARGTGASGRKARPIRSAPGKHTSGSSPSTTSARCAGLRHWEERGRLPSGIYQVDRHLPSGFALPRPDCRASRHPLRGHYHTRLSTQAARSRQATSGDSRRQGSTL